MFPPRSGKRKGAAIEPTRRKLDTLDGRPKMSIDRGVEQPGSSSGS